MSRGPCVLPECERPSADGFGYPVCGHHARGIHRRVEDMLARATIQQRIDSARPPKLTATPQAGNRVGFVYFAECGELVKIGFSNDPRQRMKAIGGRLLHSFAGNMRDEEAMHHRFGKQWDHGEYFRREGELAEYLDSVTR